MLYAILFILFEAIGEGLLKRYNKADLIFEAWLQWVIALILFGAWFAVAINFEAYYVPLWKLIAGFIGVRFMIFDVAYNLANKQKWNYYGTTKFYDRIMTELGGWGWMVKIIGGIVGICFLTGLS